MVTTRGASAPERKGKGDQPSAPNRNGMRGKPVATVKFGSAVVPIYKSQSGARVRFTISYHRDGARIRQVFSTLDAAKKEARLVAQRIQAGNSPAIIFKHYRELASEAQADEWFGILPKADQFKEVGVWKHRKPRKPRGK